MLEANVNHNRFLPRCSCLLACSLQRKDAAPQSPVFSLSLACQVAGQMPVLTLPGNANAWRHHE